MAEKLKPCPFCAGKAVMEKWSSGGFMYMAKCSNPDCPVPPHGYPKGRKIDEVFADWNMRVEK